MSISDVVVHGALILAGTIMLVAILILAISLATSGHGLAKQDHGSVDDCAAYPQAAMRTCLEVRAKESETKLEEAEQQSRIAISKWDEESHYVSLAMERFNDWALAFRDLRQKQCSFEASLGGGAIGAALELRRLRCVVELNQLQHSRLLERAEPFN